jgi:hypothetical protein
MGKALALICVGLVVVAYMFFFMTSEPRYGYGLPPISMGHNAEFVNDNTLFNSFRTEVMSPAWIQEILAAPQYASIRERFQKNWNPAVTKGVSENNCHIPSSWPGEMTSPEVESCLPTRPKAVIPQMNRILEVSIQNRTTDDQFVFEESDGAALEEVRTAIYSRLSELVADYGKRYDQLPNKAMHPDADKPHR